MTGSRTGPLATPQPARDDARSDPPARSPSVRLRLDPTRDRRGAVDGGWWPRSRDASAELPALITALDQRLGTITYRVSLHVDTWDNIPRKLLVGDHTVRVGWFRSMDAHGISLTTNRGGPIELLVVPPGTGRTPAEAAMAAAASGKADRARPTAILAASLDEAGRIHPAAGGTRRVTRPAGRGRGLESSRGSPGASRPNRGPLTRS